MIVVCISLENGVIPIKFSCLLVPKAVDDTAFDFSSSAGYALFLRGQFWERVCSSYSQMNESVILVPRVSRPWQEVGTSIFLDCKKTKNSVFLLQKTVGFDAKVTSKK